MVDRARRRHGKGGRTSCPVAGSDHCPGAVRRERRRRLAQVIGAMCNQERARGHGCSLAHAERWAHWVRQGARSRVTRGAHLRNDHRVGHGQYDHEQNEAPYRCKRRCPSPGAVATQTTPQPQPIQGGQARPTAQAARLIAAIAVPTAIALPHCPVAPSCATLTSWRAALTGVAAPSVPVCIASVRCRFAHDVRGIGTTSCIALRHYGPLSWASLVVIMEV